MCDLLVSYSTSLSVQILFSFEHFGILELQQLPIPALIAKVKELHDIAYQLGVEEAKEMTRGKYLNIFSRSRRQY